MRTPPPIHTDTLAKANRLANRLAKQYPNATSKAVLAIRDEFLERFQERLAKKFPEIRQGSIN